MLEKCPLRVRLQRTPAAGPECKLQGELQFAFTLALTQSLRLKFPCSFFSERLVKVSLNLNNVLTRQGVTLASSYPAD